MHTQNYRLYSLCCFRAITLVFVVILTGCIAAVPLAIDMMKGPEHSTATVLMNENADRVYAIAVQTAEANPDVVITDQDPATHTIQGTRNGKPATFKAIPVNSRETRVIVTVEEKMSDEGASPELDDAVRTILAICNELGLTCKVQGA